MRRYDLAHEFIPYLIAQFEKGEQKKEFLLKKKLLQSLAGDEEHEFNWQEFEIEHRSLSKTRSVALYTFPDPVDGAEAKFGLLFFDTKKKSTSYFTLEKRFYLTEDNPGGWVVGLTSHEKGEKTRINYGEYDKNPDKETFLSYINENRIDKKKGFSWFNKLVSK